MGSVNAGQGVSGFNQSSQKMGKCKTKQKNTDTMQNIVNVIVESNSFDFRIGNSLEIRFVIV